MKTVSTLGIGMISLAIFSMFQNCSQVSFQTIDPVLKKATIDSTTIFPPPPEDDSGTEIEVGSETFIATDRFCTTHGAQEAGRAALSPNLQFRLQSSLFTKYGTPVSTESAGTILCTDADSSALKSDLRAGQLRFERCLSKVSRETARKIKSGDFDGSIFYAVLFSDVGYSLNSPVAVTISNGTLSISRAINNPTALPGKSVKTEILYHLNPTLRSKISQIPALHMYESAAQSFEAEEAYKNCDRSASPLFVDMRSLFVNTGSFHLSSPGNGILFDILGRNALPVPHTPSRISWFQETGFAFIALPDHTGQIRGIDQLFGDNTFGPDNQFAANGYAALSKYDENFDNLITAEDRVYEDLRLWFDLNHDGHSSPDEMVSLSQAQLDAIDLRYDEGFREVDAYGNKVLYKSVARMSTGELRLVFDVWFKLP